jgi:hypothetical protein
MAQGKPYTIKHRLQGYGPVVSVGLALSLALVLTNFGPCARASADEPLKGNVEETGVAPPDNTFNPAVPMAVPVMRKKKLKGTADDNALKGQADDVNTNLQDMMGKIDDSGPLKGSAQDDDRAPLKATLTQDQLQSEDPDRDDQMLAVEWDMGQMAQPPALVGTIRGDRDCQQPGKHGPTL